MTAAWYVTCTQCEWAGREASTSDDYTPYVACPMCGAATKAERAQSVACSTCGTPRWVAPTGAPS